MSENTKANQDISSQGISIENASYIENNLDVGSTIESKKLSEEEYTPELFSKEKNDLREDSLQIDDEHPQNDRLFDQNSTDDEEFEIPAFLRKQKF